MTVSRCVCPVCTAFIRSGQLDSYEDSVAWGDECAQWLDNHVCGDGDHDDVEDYKEFDALMEYKRSPAGLEYAFEGRSEMEETKATSEHAYEHTYYVTLKNGKGADDLPWLPAAISIEFEAIGIDGAYPEDSLETFVTTLKIRTFTPAKLEAGLNQADAVRAYYEDEATLGYD